MAAFYREDWVVPYIRENFIPVAVDSYTPGSAAESEFFRKVQRGVNSFSYATASGTLLDSDGCHDMKSRMKAAVEKFASLPEGQRKPVLGEGDGSARSRPYREPPPGALIARVYCAYLERDGNDGWARTPRMYANTHDGEPTNLVEPALTWLDMLWLTETEWRSLIPEQPVEGAKVAVPPSVQRRLFVYYAADLFRRPVEKVRDGELVLTVEAVTPETVRLRLDGYARTGAEFDAADPLQGYRRGTVGGPGSDKTPALHGARFRFLGFLDYSVPKRTFDRFDVVALGEAWGWFTEGYRGGPFEPRRPLPVGLAFELVTGERPADRVTPFGALPYAFGDAYFRED